MANYLEQLAGSGSGVNKVLVPSVTLPVGAKTVNLVFRAPSGVTGEVNIFGANSANRFYANLTTGVLTLRTNSTSYNSTASGIVAGAVNTIQWEWTATQTHVRLNGVLVTTLPYLVPAATAFTQIGGYFSTPNYIVSRLDIYRIQIISASINMDWTADGVTSGTVFPETVGGNDGTLTNFVGNPWKSEATINTIDNPIPADGAFEGTATGFDEGAATLTTPVIGGGTVSATVRSL